MSEIVCICRDEDCPHCGWPETYSECRVTDGKPPTLIAYGCRKCGRRSDDAVTAARGAP